MGSFSLAKSRNKYLVMEMYSQNGQIPIPEAEQVLENVIARHDVSLDLHNDQEQSTLATSYGFLEVKSIAELYVRNVDVSAI